MNQGGRIVTPCMNYRMYFGMECKFTIARKFDQCSNHGILYYYIKIMSLMINLGVSNKQWKIGIDLECME